MLEIEIVVVAFLDSGCYSGSFASKCRGNVDFIISKVSDNSEEWSVSGLLVRFRF